MVAAPKKKPKTPRKDTKTAPKKPAPVPSSFRLSTQAFSVFKLHYKTLLGILAVYLVLNIIFASGLSSLNTALEGIKSNLNNSSGNDQAFGKALSGFGTLVFSSGASGSASASLLQMALFILVSLAIIWSLRHLLAGQAVGVKQAYYSSMYPLIPFLLVLGFIIIELLPISIGAYVVNAVVTSAVSSIVTANIISIVAFALLAGWSLYMVCGSILAVYIVTLPEMMPRDALRAAKKLVNGRRAKVLPKLAFLPLVILAVMAVIVLPLIIFATPLVVPAFYILSSLSIVFVHSYLYCLYRGLLE